ncbi:ThuA domain-containing protein [Arcticibacterium luteifluviistationis]|uniref:HHIP-like protein 1 n=1 Tax=Arcticibacterium luteifluviistationis TaxID=1784714 RepID=A0A2Z4GGV7_9BACT|nr:ThuA domain-containing protein [Arcticibacterium luteifluviistationis]AWW00255.1 HHIP-like protein 1 [Arcticibacterium luteifluviistationis]
MKIYVKQLILLPVLICTMLSVGMAQNKKVLVFSKTKGWRHKSIEPGKTFFAKIGKEENLDMTFSENAEDMNEDNLKQFSAVVFLNTTGNILDDRQQTEFERYIQAGGGFMGIHSATDTEYEWPWYNKLVGGYFESHPGGAVSNVQMGKMIVEDNTHPSTKHLSKTFEREDEFYSFKSLQNDLIKVLITVDEDSYEQGTNGDWHPMSWYHEFDGGKSFYTNYGHVFSTFETEVPMQKHMLEGLKSVLADKLDFSKSHSLKAPEENRFVKTILANNLNEPTELAAMPNGKVILVERRGDVKVWLPEKEEFKTANSLDVFSTYEYGLMGVGLDPNFRRNNWVYIYYTPNTDAHNEQFLSRFTYDQEKDELDMASEKVMLKVKIKGDNCCHTGGSIDWDSKGNLYLSTGDDTNPFASDGFGPIDFRDGRDGWDALGTSGNTNDLRGKVLRIKPTKDGSYVIPQGNLYAEGTPNTRPEIFVMGCRNPYRISVDKKTDRLYWGDVGPDAGKTVDGRGSEGLVEFNQTTESGFFGWPIIVGDNRPYNKYNFETKVSGEPYDVLKPVNDSPHNTGLKNLPPAREPWMYYGYGESEDYPLFGKGGCNPMAGPVYHSEDFRENEEMFPSYYDDKIFLYEWIRDWIMVVTLDKDGKYSSMEPFMPSTHFNHPMDMTFSKDGVMYLLEYGPKWSAQNEEATLTRIVYNAGNRPPAVKIAANKATGKAPLTTSFSADGTIDYDGDDLSYAWDFAGGAENSTEKNPTVSFKNAGEYIASLTVTDALGSSSKETMIIKVGNEVPAVDISVRGNQSFYLGNAPINYTIKVNDAEDGTIGKGINSQDVVVSIDYLEGYDKNAIAIGHQQNVANANGRRLIADSDCLACHTLDQKSIGPDYKSVASKYPSNNTNINLLTKKIISGGAGVWGETAMAPHPSLAKADAEAMVKYILSVNDQKASLPAKGVYTASAHKDKKAGAYLIQATYLDKGGDIIGSQSGSETLALRSPLVEANKFDDSKGTMGFDVPDVGELVIATGDNTWIKFNEIDLTGISNVKLLALGMAGQTAGGIAEFRIGGTDGQLIGKATVGATNTAPITVKLKRTKGINDLYVVFKNKDTNGKPLFGVKSLEFGR